MHVVPPGTPNEPILERLRSLIPDEAAHRGIRSEVRVIENADVPAGICDAAERFRADRLCLGSRGHSGLLAGVIGSVAHAVIARSRRPVLVVCAPAP